MNQHRRVEIAVREHAYDMVQMRPNLFDTRLIVWVICRHYNFAAIFEEMEVMCRCVMGKAHHMVASLNNTLLALALVGLCCLLPHGTNRNSSKQKRENESSHVTLRAPDFTKLTHSSSLSLDSNSRS